jgi:integrase/recombinase XerD
MTDTALLGPWVRRFLLEHLAGERNCSRHTQRSYRDTLRLLLPFVAGSAHKPIDRLGVADLSASRVRAFLGELEEKRGCGAATRNQRLAAIHALARFVGTHGPEHVAWCGEVRGVPFKKAPRPLVSYLEKEEMDALLASPDAATAQGQRDHAVLLFLYNSGARADEAAQVRIADLHLGLKPDSDPSSVLTHLLRAGVDINTIRAWLGHVSLATTNVYAEVDLEMKAKALASCAIDEDEGPGKPWREDRGLMEFLRTL